MGGIALPQLLQAQGENRGRLGHKANIMVFLAGGPPHLDMFDMKPDAPEEIRGEFSPISTTVPGFQVCEHLPMLAARAHQYSVIRSLYGAVDRHDIYQCLTGRVFSPNQPVGGWPCLGCGFQVKRACSTGSPSLCYDDATDEVRWLGACGTVRLPWEGSCSLCSDCRWSG